MSAGIPAGSKFDVLSRRASGHILLDLLMIRTRGPRASQESIVDRNLEDVAGEITQRLDRDADHDLEGLSARIPRVQ